MFLSLLSFITVFTVIVLVHEFGHYIAARKAGVRVYEFSIGFPFSPKILTLFRYRETEFTLRLLPLGGFVGFAKEGGEDATDLLRASRFKRAIILSSGSVFNILYALTVFIFVFYFKKDMSLGTALISGMEMVWNICSQTMGFILSAAAGNGTTEGLVGPVGIASLAGSAAGRGVFSLLYFSGFLSMSLGIINLLPLPALDGGHLCILLIESVRRKQLNPKLYQAVSVLGILMFVILTIFITYRDIVRLAA